MRLRSCRLMHLWRTVSISYSWYHVQRGRFIFTSNPLCHTFFIGHTSLGHVRHELLRLEGSRNQMADVINIVLVYCEGQEIHCRQSIMMAHQKTVHAPLSLLLRMGATNVSIYMYIPLLQELSFGTINCQSSVWLWQKQVRWRSGGNEHGGTGTVDRLEYSTRPRHCTTGITGIEHNSHKLIP